MSKALVKDTRDNTWHFGEITPINRQTLDGIGLTHSDVVVVGDRQKQIRVNPVRIQKIRRIRNNACFAFTNWRRVNYFGL